MSWDADLVGEIDGHEVDLGLSWNYTHNCNEMAARVLETYGQQVPHDWWDGPRPGSSWWRILDGQTASDSVAFLNVIIGGLNEAPAMFREMNPENGWGDYDSFLKVLTAMRDAAVEWPSARWSVNG